MSTMESGIVIVRPPAAGHFWAGWGRERNTPGEGFTVFPILDGPGGTTLLGDRGDMQHRNARQAHIDLRPNRDCLWKFTALPTMDAGPAGGALACDLSLVVTWRVSDAHVFWTALAGRLADVDRSLPREEIESRLQDRLREHVAREVRGRSFSGLAGELPLSWWRDQLQKWLAPVGISADLALAPAWHSADRERARHDAERQQRLREVEEARDEERRLELERAQRDAAYHSARQAIEQNLLIEARERQAELVRLDDEFRLAAATRELELTEAGHRREQAMLRHQLAMASLREDAAAADRARRTSEEVSQAFAASTVELRELIETMKSSQADLASLVQQLLARDSARAYNAVEQLANVYHVHARHFGMLGISAQPNPRTMLLAGLREAESSVRPRVGVRLLEARCRTIGTRKVSGLTVNKPLQFEIASARSGYVTVINVGTSGDVLLHVPNCYAPVPVCSIAGGIAAMVPGQPLLPWEQLRANGLDYVEVGPGGWQVLAAIVSDHPLVDAAIISRSRADDPLVLLAPDEVETFYNRLAGLPSAAWSVGIASFLVE